MLCEDWHYIIVAIFLAFLSIFILILYKIFLERWGQDKKKKCENGVAEPTNEDESDEIDPKDIIYAENQQMISSGMFGKVTSARLREQNGSEIPIAIKSINNDMTMRWTREDAIDVLQKLLAEIVIMREIGHHKNIVGFIGAITTDIENYSASIVLEYCAGNLHTLLLKQQFNFVDDINESNVDTLSSLKSSHLLKWAEDIAAGLEYLHSRGIIHRDLAARNILLDYPWHTIDEYIVPGYAKIAKISDFGMSTRENHPPPQGRRFNLMPVRWVPLETLQSLTFSRASDVWAFGVILWEMFSLGQLPYRDELATDGNVVENLVRFLSDGNNLAMPPFVNPELWALMLICWDRNPQMRPNASQLKYHLNQINLQIMETLRTRLIGGIVVQMENAQQSQFPGYEVLPFL